MKHKEPFDVDQLMPGTTTIVGLAGSRLRRARWRGDHAHRCPVCASRWSQLEADRLAPLAPRGMSRRDEARWAGSGESILRICPSIGRPMACERVLTNLRDGTAERMCACMRGVRRTAPSTSRAPCRSTAVRSGDRNRRMTFLRILLDVRSGCFEAVARFMARATVRKSWAHTLRR